MTTPTQAVHVNLADRSYDIEIGSGNFDRVGRMLTECGKVSHAVVITDENVQEPHAIGVAESLGGQRIEVDVITVEPGEPSKSIDMAAGIWNGLLELGADRRSVVVAAGGGVVGDLAGFIAATFARGIRFFQVPTSLLAQVDSSVGGKVGINLPGAKNMVGAFLQPIGVLIDTTTLATLPQREYIAGLGEVVKYGVILDAELFDYLEANAAGLLQRDHEVLIHVITRCCRLKADVVENDAPFPPSDDVLEIGRAEGGNNFIGIMDEFVIAQRVLSGAEMRSHFSDGVPGVVTAVDPAGKAASTWAALKAR